MYLDKHLKEVRIRKENNAELQPPPLSLTGWSHNAPEALHSVNLNISWNIALI